MHSVDSKQKYATQIRTFRTWTHNVCVEVTFNRGLVVVYQNYFRLQFNFLQKPELSIVGESLTNPIFRLLKYGIRAQCSEQELTTVQDQSDRVNVEVST